MTGRYNQNNDLVDESRGFEGPVSTVTNKSTIKESRMTLGLGLTRETKKHKNEAIREDLTIFGQRRLNKGRLAVCCRLHRAQHPTLPSQVQTY